MRGTASQVTDLRSSNVTRQLNLPPSYVLIHRVSTAGIGVLCQLECEGPFRGRDAGLDARLRPGPAMHGPADRTAPADDGTAGASAMAGRPSSLPATC